MAVLSWLMENARQERELLDLTLIGRAPSSHICLPDGTISRLHARIVRSEGSWILEDGSSANGCLVNGVRQRRSVLSEGDVIRIGSFELTFRLAPSAGGSANPAGPGSGTARPGADPNAQTSAIDLKGRVRDDGGSARIATTTSVVAPPFKPEGAEDPRILARKLRVCYEISKATAATLDLPCALDRILAAVFEILEAAERSFILLRNPATGEMTAAAAKRRGNAEAGEISVPRTALDQAMKNREAVLCRDALTDSRYAQARSIVNLGVRSMMIAPLIFQDQALGAIYVDTRSAAGQFMPGDLELLSLAATQGAACVANVRLHEELIASARLAAVGQTVAGLTHCVKNILQGIQGGSFILDKGIREGKLVGAKTGWEMVKRNNAFLEELVFDLLTYSKERLPEYEIADVNALCKDICDLASARGQPKGVSVVFKPDPAAGQVEIDPKGIRRCVLNLASNAVDACSERGGTVTFSTQPAGADGLFRIFVRDTGCGMSDQTKAKLFAVFFSTKGSKGTGLGLPVTKKIVEEHGGRIEVESEQGKGATFTICLPTKRPQQVSDRNLA